MNKYAYKYVSLCMGGSKGKAGIQIQCIPERRIQLVKGMHIIAKLPFEPNVEKHWLLI